MCHQRDPHTACLPSPQIENHLHSLRNVHRSVPDCLLVCLFICLLVNRLVGQVVKASASRAEDPGFESRLRRDFSRFKKNGTLVATLPGAWRYRVSAETGWPGVSTL